MGGECGTHDEKRNSHRVLVWESGQVKKMRRAGHVARNGFVQNAHLCQARIADGDRSFGVPLAQKYILKDNISEVILEDMKWIHVALL
jgi:hypothetical protein